MDHHDVLHIPTVGVLIPPSKTMESKSEIPNGFLYSARDLESRYGKECLKEAMNLFYQVPEPDTVSWNSIIAGFVWIESLGTSEFV